MAPTHWNERNTRCHPLVGRMTALASIFNISRRVRGMHRSAGPKCQIATMSLSLARGGRSGLVHFMQPMYTPVFAPLPRAHYVLTRTLCPSASRHTTVNTY